MSENARPHGADWGCDCHSALWELLADSPEVDLPLTDGSAMAGALEELRKACSAVLVVVCRLERDGWTVLPGAAASANGVVDLDAFLRRLNSVPMFGTTGYHEEDLAVLPIQAGHWMWGCIAVMSKVPVGMPPLALKKLSAMCQQLVGMIIRSHCDFLAEILDRSDEAVAVSTTEFQLIWCNKVFENLTGRSHIEMRRESILNLFSSADQQRLSCEISELKDGTKEDIPFVILNSQGESVEVDAFLRRGLLGGVEVLTFMFRDARNRRRAEEQREEISHNALQQEKLATLGTLVAGIGHEINNPLTILTGLIQRIREEESVSSNAACREMVNASLATIQRISKIVRGLRTYAHSSQAPHGRGHGVNLNRVVLETVDLFSTITKKGVLRVELQLAPGAVLVRGDEGQFSQVVLNLLTNARDAVVGKPNPLITISSGVKDDQAWLEVRDNGCGFSPVALARAFDPFFTTKPPGHGTGLGLTLVHKMVTAYGGQVSLENSSLEGGGVVLLTLELFR